VFVTCEGSTTQITHREDLESFAVSDEQAVLVYTTSGAIKGTTAVTWTQSIADLVDLKSGSTRTMRSPGWVVATCGGVLPLRAPRWVGKSARDLLSGDELSFAPYLRFRCSTDRAAVVGADKDQGGDLFLGLSRERRLAEAQTRYTLYFFDMSPNGSKVAYYGLPNDSVCLYSAGEPTECVGNNNRPAGLPSVNNSGEVLVAVGTGQGCHYRGSFYFSPDLLPGATSNDECLGIGYWQPGLETIELIEPLGRDPQWISPATAKLLRDWAARQGVRTTQ
jgi:hypothetical protein